MSFEQRYYCRYYPWADYEKPGMRVDEWEVRASYSRVQTAFIRVRDRFIGKRYAVGQLVNITSSVLWARVGVKREASLRKGLVCSELVWHFIDELGGDHQRRLRAIFRDPDLFTPGDLKDFCDGRKSTVPNGLLRVKLFERVA
jgi:hypothetical protein